MILQKETLRSRKDDVPLPADFFLDRFNRQMNKSIKGFTPDDLAMLEDYPSRDHRINIIRRSMTLVLVAPVLKRSEMRSKNG
ncbi:hypothetical protein [Desulfobacula sp.]|uniref:hypothetical protein n=1 Tax=Desulfobacula sp. TaxID=2593537 RepID=UPI003FA479C2